MILKFLSNNNNKLLYVIIILVIILLVVFYLTRKQKKIESFVEFSTDIDVELQNHIVFDVMSCLADSMTNTSGGVVNTFIVNNTTSNSIVKNTKYVNTITTQNKFDDVLNFINLITATYLLFFTVYLRLGIVDGFCTDNKTILLKICNSYIKLIKNLANYYNNVYKLKDNSTTLKSISNADLIMQFKCIRKQFLPVDSQEIYYYIDFIKSLDTTPDPTTPPPTRPPGTTPGPTTPPPDPTRAPRQKVDPLTYIDFTENSDLVLFTSNILELIIKIATNQTFDYCDGVSLDENELLPLLYKMFVSETNKSIVQKRCPLTITKIDLPFGTLSTTGTPSASGSGTSGSGSGTSGSGSGTSGSGSGTSASGSGTSASGSGASGSGASASGSAVNGSYDSSYDMSGDFGGLSGADISTWGGMFDSSLFPNNQPPSQISGATSGSLIGSFNPLTGVYENSSSSGAFNFNFFTRSDPDNSLSQISPTLTPTPTQNSKHNSKVVSYMEPTNINLINAKGPNNFFLPNIIIEED